MAWAQVGSQIVSIASLAILLRILSPQDYGLVAMVVPLVWFLRLFTTLGLHFTTVQRSEINDAEVSAAFWVQFLASVLIALVTIAIAPLVGSFYGKPELVGELRNLTIALSFTSIVTALGAQPQALLERRLQMQTLGRIRVTAQLSGAAAAIVAALFGIGVWALVVQQYVELALLTICYFAASRWRPSWPTNWAALSQSIQLGGWLAATAFVLYVADNLDRVLVGRLVTSVDVGLYSQAYNVMMKPVYLVTTPLIGLSLSSLSRAVRHPVTSQQFVEAFHRVVAIALVPVSFGLALVGNNVMPTLGGENWRDAGSLLTILSLGIFAQGIVILNGYVLMASGHVRACFFAGLVIGIALIMGYLLGWLVGQSLGNPTLGIAGGYAATITLAGLGPHNWFCLRTAGHQVDAVVRTWLPAAKASVAMALCVATTGWFFPDTQPTLRMIAQIAVGLLVYLLLARGELRWLAGRFFTRGM